MKSISSAMNLPTNKNQFKLFCLVACFCADLIFIIFLRYVIFAVENKDKFISMLSGGQRAAIKKLPHMELESFFNVLALSIDVMLFSYLLINFIFYILFYKENHWGVSYLKNGTAMFGILFSLWVSYIAWSYSIGWSLLLLMLAPIYTWIWIQLRKHYPKTVG